MGVLEQKLWIYEFKVRDSDRIDIVDLTKGVQDRIKTEVRVQERDNLGSETKNDISFLVYFPSGEVRDHRYLNIVGAVREACSDKGITVDYLGEYSIPIKLYSEIKF